MANEQVVQALVPNPDAARLREELVELDRADVEAVAISAPDPATYRGEEGDLELHKLVRFESLRLVMGAVVGAAIGALFVLVLPWLHEWMPASLIIFAFGGAWGGAIVATSFGVQVDKRDDPLPDTHYEVDQADTADLRVLTIHVPHGRTQVINLLEDHPDVVLLDSWDPKVGPRREPENR